MSLALCPMRGRLPTTNLAAIAVVLLDLFLLNLFLGTLVLLDLFLHSFMLRNQSLLFFFGRDLKLCHLNGGIAGLTFVRHVSGRNGSRDCHTSRLLCLGEDRIAGCIEWQIC